MKKLNLKGRSKPPPSRRMHPNVNARMEAYWNIDSEDLCGGWAMEPPSRRESIYGRTGSFKSTSFSGGHWSTNCSCGTGSIPGKQHSSQSYLDYFRTGSARMTCGFDSPQAYMKEDVCAGIQSRCCSDLPPDYSFESLSDEDERDYQDDEDEKTTSLQTSSFSITKAISSLNSQTNHAILRESYNKPGSKLKRRQAYYRERKQGRSRSLTHIDRMDGNLVMDEADSRSEPQTSNEGLLLPIPCEVEARHQRRKKLTGSQVCSSEYFSVHFDDELGIRHEEFLPAIRGLTLGEALRPFLERQHVTLANVDVFVEASSTTSLPSPSATDTYLVAGKNIIIKLKAHKHHDSKFHCRSFKDSNRKRSQRHKGIFVGSSAEDAPSVVSSPVGGNPGDMLGPTSPHTLIWTPTVRQAASSTTSVSHEGSLKVKQSKQPNRWSGLFSNSAKDNSKMDLLAEQLNGYSLYGIPGSTLQDHNEDEGKYALEDDVRSIVIGWDNLSERVQKQQTAIWELVETEVVYLKTVKVITELFLVCLYNLQTKNILNEIDREELFSNIPDIYASNRSLWLNSLYPMVEKARNSRAPLQASQLRHGFLEFGGTCSPYIRYCLDQTKCQRYCREKYHDNELFKAYLAWCETRKECNRLRLMDILVRPMQRMTKYSLLLKAILKHTENPQERQDLEEMIQSVETFVLSVNGALRNRQEAERLKGISDRIEAYDAVETREEELEGLVKAHSSLDLFRPMPGCGVAERAFLFEGDLRIKDAITKLDTRCFLFTDMLLVCKASGRKGEKVKVVRPPFVIDRLLPKELSKDPCAFGLVYLNEYGTAVAAFTLHASDSKIVKTWLDNIRKAQKLYSEAKRREVSGLVTDGLEEQDSWSTNYLTSRSPRDCSSYASQLSSLIHSHSGSIEMEAGVPSRGVSFELEQRASSFSSDDATNGAAIDGQKNKSPCTESIPIKTSPRSERRSFLSKSPTPNRLSVKVPTGNLSGQSLPNLSSASESLPQTYSIHSLVVPKGFLSPTHRGVSYPPPSPRNLTRSEALTSARNPPLIKSRNISSTEVAKSSPDLMVPHIRAMPQTPIEEPISENIKLSKHEAGTEIPAKDSLCTETYKSNSVSEAVNCVGNQTKRLSRSERSDMKRYYTAGAIEDIKKEVMKDTSIHKRLSWNCGPQTDATGFRPLSSVDPLSSRGIASIQSMASIPSSSGVSSTTSLFLCGISDPGKCKETGGCPSGRTSPGDIPINVAESGLTPGQINTETQPETHTIHNLSPENTLPDDRVCSGSSPEEKGGNTIESSHL